MDEKNIEKKLVNSVKAIGGLALKFVSPGTNGVPDRIILIACGKIAFVEVKSKGEKPRAVQLRMIKKIRDLGFKVYVLDDEKDIGGILDEIQSA